MLAEANTGEKAIRLLGADWEFAAPSHWKAEFCNVVWKAVQQKRITGGQVDAVLGRAGALPIESVDVAQLWMGAMMRAITANHPAYDTLFVELAARLRTKVASFDTALQRKFPSIVRNPAALLR